jgi:hypothetical protein
MPKDSVSGEVVWFTPESGKGKGRILQSNRDLAMARSFSCGNGYALCGATFVPGTTTFLIGSQGVSFGRAAPIICSVQVGECTGSKANVRATGVTYTWSSNDANIISISGVNTLPSVSVNGVGGGSTNLIADVEQSTTGCGWTAPGGGSVQVPTSLKVLSVAVLPTATSDTNPTGDYGCLPQPGSGQVGDWGIKIAITYQVMDQNAPAQPINSASMEPQETVTNTSFNGIPIVPDPIPTFDDIGPSRISGTSQFTNSAGQFKDAPYGICYFQSFSSYNFTQKIQVLIGGNPSALLRTNVVVATSSAAGKGSITNGSDIVKSR